MARRRRRHSKRRHYRGLGSTISLPSLGSMKDLNPLKWSVRAPDVAIGALVGMVGSGLVKMGLAKASIRLPAAIAPYSDIVCAGAAGLAAYALLQKKSKSRAQGIALGALLAGAVPTAWAKLKQSFPSLASYTDIHMAGVIVDDLNGVIVDDLNGYADHPALADVAAHAMAAIGSDEEVFVPSI
jgi:hypothetical protein